MTGTLPLIAYHGWGFSPAIWDRWRKQLPSRIDLRVEDRGYFGGESAPVIPEQGPVAVITHSYGLHRVPERLLRRTALLVVVGGFHSFHPPQGEARRRSQLTLRRMVRRFRQEPEAVLCDFHRNCWRPADPPPFRLPPVNRERLLGDLERLGRSERSMPRMRKGAEICILHGTSDKIVPADRARPLLEWPGASSRMVTVEGGGHALPLSHTDACLERVTAACDLLINRHRN